MRYRVEEKQSHKDLYISFSYYL